MILNYNEKKLVTIIEDKKRYVKGELELNLFDGVWTAMDYREDLECAFPIDTQNTSDIIITELDAGNLGIDVRRCCDVCGIYYVG